MIKIVYVDDNLDRSISRYLALNYKYDGLDKKYDEIDFSRVDGYESLINNNLVKEANIIVIDSKLFENDNVNSSKFTGEEFKMILKKIFPFIEVIVITQNELEEEYGTIRKYNAKLAIPPQEYYSKYLKNVLDKAVNNILIYRNIANKIKSNDVIDKMLIENILNSLNGINVYDELKKSDIDEIIKTFKELEKEINE